MEGISLIYIDDNIDPNITYYFVEIFNSEIAKIKFDEIEFTVETGYEELISNDKVKEADVIIIDSRLFENGRVMADKFTGEEFKIILKKVFPYKEVVVITQNEIEECSGVIPKFNSKDINQIEYYNSVWKPVLEEAIKEVLVFRKLSRKLLINQSIERVLVEQIMDSIEGSSEYQKLTTEDIDRLIEKFEELNGCCDEERL